MSIPMRTLLYIITFILSVSLGYIFIAHDIALSVCGQILGVVLALIVCAMLSTL